MNRAPSPFKFLDSYRKSDKKVFFGRDTETTDLYDALSGVKHLLAYGPSGSGKTSLVECGLRNRFSDADWFALTIRKGDHISKSIFAAINGALTTKIDINATNQLPVDSSIGFSEAAHKLFKERFQPIYLLFDQFEELLISGETDEKRDFFIGLNQLIHHNFPCRIVLIMREEFIGHLSEFESLCPSILRHRFRVEKMDRKNVEKVIFQILQAPDYKPFFNVDDSQKLTEKILSRLPDKKKEIELSHVQVFLGELWDRALEVKKENGLPLLSASLIHADDDLERILESFLIKQMKELDLTFGKGVPLELLAAMISEKFTKLQLSEPAIMADLDDKKVISKNPISDLLNALEKRRILRSLKIGDETQYEISHDSLALVVGQNLTEEMKLREKAADVYSVYKERTGLLSQDEIDYLRPFKRSLDYPVGLQKRIGESTIAIQEQRKRDLEKQIADKNKKRKIRILIGAIIILIGFTTLVIFLAIDAQEQTLLAKQKNLEASIAKERTQELLKLVMQGRERYENIEDSLLNEKLSMDQTLPIDSLIVPRGYIGPKEKNGNRTYLMWIDVPSFRKLEIQEVHYYFCPGFINRRRISTEPTSSFSIGYLGYGYCPGGYDINIILKTGDTIHRNLPWKDFVAQNP
ncbi:ATP-binding protein [Ulvibacterium marinum]|uniref:ATP-binding protein n=1 Tax=Ulvibacterium marinum TaxID=2419782 RepID=A0A3B0C0Z3_9FLAO|nr:ATP-binding protein [Ulvibacterium marinum]RKN79775.1 ATP-binding protein [Ulvibacterium marinum]